MNRLLAKFRPGERDNEVPARLGHVRVVARNGRAAGARRRYVLSAAETAECTCPEFCERDHGNE